MTETGEYHVFELLPLFYLAAAPRSVQTVPRLASRLSPPVLTTMHIDPKTGWLDGARRVESPNCDDRPDGCLPELIVIHGISLPPGEFGGPYIDQLFTNQLDPDEHPYFGEIRGLEVSSHLLIRREGEVVQYVPFHRRAWHAGKSSYEGRPRCNDFSIGIELEGTDSLGYLPEQYTRLADVVMALVTIYPLLVPERIVGHSDIAPGRKTDPGPAFDWPTFRRLLDVERPR